MFYRNEIWVGLLFGLLLPLCSFVILFEIFNLLESKGAASGTGFSDNFRERTLAIVAIALNILPMNLYKKRRWDLSMRGVVIATALLAFLVCQTRPFSRETLAELLWDDRDPQQAQANLRSLLSGMRTRLKPYLTITRHTVAFNHESTYWLDTAEFLRLLQHEEAKPGPPGMLSSAGLLHMGTGRPPLSGGFFDGLYVWGNRGI